MENNGHRVLIVAPSLDMAKNVSGVSAVTNFIIANNKECKYEHFLQGRSDEESGAWKRVLRVWRNYRAWKAVINGNDNVNDNLNKNGNEKIIHYNFPLDTPSIIRDFFFLRAAHKMRKRMVIHVHGGLYLFKEQKPYIIKKFLNEVFSMDCPFIVLSNKEKEQIQSTYHTKNVFVLPNCVELPDWNDNDNQNDNQNDNLNGNGDTLHILYLGRIEPNKGMDYLYDAMKELKGQNIKLHFAGIEQGANGYVEKYKALLGDRFIYEGVVAGKEKTALFRRCQVFVLPSLYEGLPMSLLESMSYGLVPLTTNVGSIGEYVKNGINGLLLKVKDSHSITEALTTLINEKALVKQLSEAARHTIFSQLNPKEYIEKLNSIYAKTV